MEEVFMAPGAWVGDVFALLAVGALCMIAPSIWATAVGVLLSAVAIGATRLHRRRHAVTG